MKLSNSWAAIAAGAVGLAVLDGMVSRSSATSNVGGWIAGAGKAVDWFLSPAVPAFSTSSSTAATATAAETAAEGSGSSAAAGAATTPPASSASSQPTGGSPDPYTGLGAIQGTTV